MRYLAASAAVLGLAASTATAALTATWVENTITAAAITNDPQLANMQSWSLMVNYTEGDWASAGLRAVLPAGSTFYRNPLAGNTKPNPAIAAAFPAVLFNTYVTSPPDTGSADAPAILGGFPEGQPTSFGGAADPIPGTFSVSWGDLITSPPGTYEITRLTFPQGMIPEINPLSQTSVVNPTITIEIPAIPEPTALGFIAAAGLLAVRRRKA